MVPRPRRAPPEGRRYWRLQRDALARNVAIRRVFIYDEWTEELAAVAREQRDAGVEVRRVQQDALPLGARGIIGLWDGTCGLEVSYDASGQTAATPGGCGVSTGPRRPRAAA